MLDKVNNDLFFSGENPGGLPKYSKKVKKRSGKQRFAIEWGAQGQHQHARAGQASGGQTVVTEETTGAFDKMLFHTGLLEILRQSQQRTASCKTTYDLIRHAKLSGLRDMEDGGELLPFISSFYGSPSTYLWEDKLGVVHDIQQGEGGRRGAL